MATRASRSERRAVGTPAEGVAEAEPVAGAAGLGLPVAERPGERPDAVLAGLRPAWVGVDLDALEHNLAVLRRRVGSARILGVIKADAYGHGAVPVGRALAAAGVDMLGVALVEEGIELRRAGVTAPLLVLGTAQPRQLDLVQELDLVPTISSLDQLRMWVAHTALGGRVQPVHLKVDTGMARLGIPGDAVPEALAILRRAPGLRLDGVASHFAESEDLASPRNAEQERRFEGLLELLAPAERERVVVHLANSAGALHHAGSRHGMVRLGLAMYGYDPAGVDPELRPVMSLVARIVQLREVAPGAPIGYNGRWRAPRASRIGVVPVGYADGYAWRLANRAEAIVAGRRVPVVGAISMDMAFVNVTDCDARIGSAVLLMGEASGERIDARDLASRAGTIPYEILCLLGLRLPRCTTRGDRTIEVRSRLAQVIQWVTT